MQLSKVYIMYSKGLPAASAFQMCTFIDLMSSPPQHRRLSVGLERSRYLVTVKSWWTARPLARLVFDGLDVSGIDTPWLYESNSIMSLPWSDVLSPGMPSISQNMFCIP